MAELDLQENFKMKNLNKKLKAGAAIILTAGALTYGGYKLHKSEWSLIEKSLTAYVVVAGSIAGVLDNPKNYFNKRNHNLK